MKYGKYRNDQTAQMNRNYSISAARRLPTFVLIFVCLAFGQFSAAGNITASPYNYPGGVVELFVPKQSDILPEVRYGIREPAIIEQATRWRLLIGLQLATLPGEYVVYIKQPEMDLPAYSLNFSVEQKSYPMLELKPGENGSSRHIDHGKLSELTFSNTEQPNLPLIPPMAGQWADFFGHLAANPESRPNIDSSIAQNYVSLTTTELGAVSAPQNAIVSRIVMDQGPRSLATVFLDHGRGLYSIITGLSDISVETGNGVIAGAVIGKLPAGTDSSAPAVLIWQCQLNGVYVNPLILTQL